MILSTQYTPALPGTRDSRCTRGPPRSWPSVDHFEFETVFRARHGAAFDRVSRSIRSCLFLLPSRTSSFYQSNETGGRTTWALDRDAGTCACAGALGYEATGPACRYRACENRIRSLKQAFVCAVPDIASRQLPLSCAREKSYPRIGTAMARERALLVPGHNSIGFLGSRR